MIDVVYIAGSGRSGSTLLERMLGQTEAFVAVGELRHLWRADYKMDLCGCGIPFQNCPFWQPILTDVFAGSANIDFATMLTLRNQVDRMRYLPYMLLPWKTAVYRQRHAQYTGIIQQIYRQVQTRTGKPFIVDSSKDISTLYLLATMPSIRLHVIHLVRDSRAVAYSWQRKRVNPQVTQQTRLMPTYSPAYAAFDWLYRNLFVTWGKSLYDSYSFVRYEDLVREPLIFLRAFNEKLGLHCADWPFIRNVEVDLTGVAHTASGNPMRFQQETLTLREDDVWRRKMQSGPQRLVTGMTWPWLRRYHYL
jgi:hypothetical protein